MEKVTLKANKRTISGRKVKSLRAKGIIPANVFGKKVTSLAVEVDQKEFFSVFAKAHETGLVQLNVSGDTRPVLIHNVTYHPVTRSPLHIDFFQVDLKEKVTAKVPVELTGESPAVKDKVGVLLTLLTELEVEALPADLPEKITVATDKLTAIDEAVKVSDLTVSEKVKILTDSASEIVKVAPLVSKEAEAMAKEDAQKAAAAAAAQTEAEAAPAADGATPPSTSESSPKPEAPAKKE